MNKIFYTTVILLCFFMAGCSKDDKASRLEVVRTDATFDATGGIGSIQVKSGTPVSATSNADWCKVGVSDQTVTLTVDQNHSLKGRTTMVTINSADERTEVPISQPGAVLTTGLSNFAFSGEAESQTFEILYDVGKPKFGETPEWLTYELVENILTVKVAQSSVNRVCEFSLIYFGNKQTFYIGQVASISGEYDFFSFGTRLDVRRKGKATVKKEGDGYAVEIPTIGGSNFNAKLMAQYANRELEFSFPQHVATHQSASTQKIMELYLCGFSSAKIDDISWSKKLRYTAKADYNKDGKLAFTFSDLYATWPEKHMKGFILGIFNAKIEPSDSNATIKGKFQGLHPAASLYIEMVKR